MRVFNQGRLISSPQRIPLARREFLRGLTSLGVLAFLSSFITSCSQKTEATSPGLPLSIAPGVGIELPEPRLDSDVSIEEVLLRRRSVREYTGEALTLEEVSQLLWAAQGITSPRGFRTAPSASALYPLETYIVIGDVEDCSKGVYRYEPAGHKLVKFLDGDYRLQLSRAGGVYYIEGGAVYIVFNAVYERTTSRSGEIGVRYVDMEVGHAAQNVCLQAVALGLGTVVMGSFSGALAKRFLELPEDEETIYLMAIGRA